ncbi:MAG: hypothetical protein JWO93_292 [Micrococcaceae bacterium]|nr:hypothetical protein [Micrococcaceae bacterium]
MEAVGKGSAGSGAADKADEITKEATSAPEVNEDAARDLEKKAYGSDDEDEMRAPFPG